MHILFYFRDNGAVEELIKFIRWNGNQHHLDEILEESWKKHSGKKCKLTFRQNVTHSLSVRHYCTNGTMYLVYLYTKC